MSLWWRAECGSIDHPKLLKLSDAMHRAWYTLMCVAGANGGALPPTEDIAIRLRMNKAKVAEWITKLVQADLFDNVDGVFVPHNWTKRQYKTDKTDPTAAERMKRYRKNKRNGVTEVTDRNDSNQLRPEAEAKADTESKQSRADAGPLLDEDSGRKILALQTSVSLAFTTRGMPVPSLDRCSLWISQGYGKGTVLGAVDRVLKRGKAISTLDYFDAAIREDHVRAPAPSLQVVSSGVWVDEGTQEWDCHQTESFRLTRRGTPVTDQKDENGRLTGRRGWFFKSRWPEGFNDFGERMSTTDAEDAA